jgi:energy-coupling factor transport system permease protein
MTRSEGLALTTWLIWGAAASLPLLIGRNPFPLVVTLAAVGTVRVMSVSSFGGGMGWSLVIRAGLVLAVISVLFNVLTVRAGDLVIVRLPDWTRWLAGELTWNAVLYGLLSALAILGLIVTWATVATAIDWAGLTRILPNRLLGFAVGGSIALNLIPQTVASIGEIREAATARGFAVSGPRSLATVVSPVLSGSMERALRLSEVLDSRGFGSREPAQRGRSLSHQIGWNALLAGSCLAAYALVVGAVAFAGIGLGVALTGTALLVRGSQGVAVKRTRYRIQSRSRADWLVIAGSVISAIACVVARNADVHVFMYEPYPSIEMPVTSLWLLLGLFGLFVPALVPPANEYVDD